MPSRVNIFLKKTLPYQSHLRTMVPPTYADRMIDQPTTPHYCSIHYSHQSIDRSTHMSLISNFFVLSPRGDTILSKIYRVSSANAAAHERSHAEAFWRKVRFWDGAGVTVTPSPEFASTAPPVIGSAASFTDDRDAMTGGDEDVASGRKKDAPPVFLMPDGLNYIHIKRNGLIFACSSPTNVSPCTVIEVCSTYFLLYTSSSFPFHFQSVDSITLAATDTDIQGLQRLLRDTFRRIHSKKLYSSIRTTR
jgi:hypothetical protein